MTDEWQGTEPTEATDGTGPSALPGAGVAADTHYMKLHLYAPERLSHQDCLALLASGGLGRLAFSERALPAIAAVQFAVDGETLVLRVEAGAEWAATQRHAIVAFQTDHGDPFEADSWTVTAVGRLVPISASADTNKLSAPRAWRSPSPDDTFLRLDVQVLEGTRNVGSEPASTASGL